MLLVLVLVVVVVLDWRWVVMAVALFLYVLSLILTYEICTACPSPHPITPPPFPIPSFTGSESTPAANNDPLPAECPPVGTGTPGAEGYEERATQYHILYILFRVWREVFILINDMT